jgi:electron transfer flavoprotein beta subunit
MKRTKHKRPHIICCLKVVPRPEEVSVDPETRTVDRAHARSVINPPDMNLLEMALELKDRQGGQVSLLSMGPPLFEEYLRIGLALGADRAYLLSDRAFGGADTLATSYTLAQGIRRIADEDGYDLVLCGEESSDGATAQVPPGIAEWLGIPQVTYAGEIALEDGQFRAVREVKGGHEVLLAPLPAVVSVRVGVNEPRFIDFERKPWAETKAPVAVWTAADLDLDAEAIGLAGSPTTVSGLGQARSAERQRELIGGTPQEEAHALFERIQASLRPGA